MSEGQIQVPWPDHVLHVGGPFHGQVRLAIGSPWYPLNEDGRAYLYTAHVVNGIRTGEPFVAYLWEKVVEAMHDPVREGGVVALIIDARVKAAEQA